MISSSADGFINVMDLKNGLDEDDAFRVGFIACMFFMHAGIMFFASAGLDSDPRGTLSHCTTTS